MSLEKISKVVNMKRVIYSLDSKRVDVICSMTEYPESDFFKFSHCLYLEFLKSDFDLIYPKNLDYFSNHDLHEVAFHGGITFYEEKTIKQQSLKEKGKIDEYLVVKVGCDYSHLGDEYYNSCDCMDEIFEQDGEKLVKSFYKLIMSKKESN